MPLVTTQNFFGAGFVGAGIRPMPDPMGSEEVQVRCPAIVNGTGAIGDVIPMAKIPAGCIVIDWQVDNDDIDTGAATIAADLGVIVAGAVSATAANGGKWLTASTALGAPATTIGHHQATAVINALARMSPDVAERSVGFVLTAVGAGAAAANAVIGLTLTYRAAYAGN